MEECVEIVNSVCCTCLSRDRYLYKLFRVPEGVNNLYLLLSYDSVAFNEAFFRGVSDLLVCWECRAILSNITKFRLQAGEAQKLLSTVLDRKEISASQKCLSNLGKQHKTKYDSIIVFEDNFIDCGSIHSLYRSENSIGNPLSPKSLERTPVIDILNDFDDDTHISLKDLNRNSPISLKVVDGETPICLKVVDVETPISLKVIVDTLEGDGPKDVDQSPVSDSLKDFDDDIDDTPITPVNLENVDDGTYVNDVPREVDDSRPILNSLKDVVNGAPISLQDIDGDTPVFVEVKIISQNRLDRTPTSQNRLQKTPTSQNERTPSQNKLEKTPKSNNRFEKTNTSDNRLESTPISLKGVDFGTPKTQNRLERTPTRQNRLEKTPTSQNRLEETPTSPNRPQSTPISLKGVDFGTPKSQNRLEKTPTSQNRLKLSTPIRVSLKGVDYGTPKSSNRLETTSKNQIRLAKTPTSQNRLESIPISDSLKCLDFGTPESVAKTPIYDSLKEVFQTPASQTPVEMKYYDPRLIEVVLIEEKPEASQSPKKEKHSIDTESTIKTLEQKTNLVEGESEKYDEKTLSVADTTKKKKFYVILDETEKERQERTKRNNVESISGFHYKDDTSLSDLVFDSNSKSTEENLQKNKRKNTKCSKEIKHENTKKKNTPRVRDYSIQDYKEKENKKRKIAKKEETTKEKVSRNIDQAKEREPYGEVFKIYFGQELLNEEQMKESRVERKMAKGFVEAPFKCESCLEVFKARIELLNHVNFHYQKTEHTKCEICHTYVYNTHIQSHTDLHYVKYLCNLCDYVSYKDLEMVQHLKDEHEIEDSDSERQERSSKQSKIQRISKIGEKTKKVEVKIERIKVADKSVRNKKITKHISNDPDKKYQCGECMECFHSNKQRWRHTQRFHREGFECDSCGKRFAFKTVLEKHMRRHGGPPLPRQRCPMCFKMVRCDLYNSHARTHTDRPTFTCAECDKVFVSRASYEQHLKYTKAHAVDDVRKFKCEQCEKRFKSRTELRDHVNYRHMGRTQHKCFVCGKAIATVRGVTRHILRAHHGIRERPLDQTCQQCGKTFRDKKGLREHESIHTGDRPLTCELCGHTFRQSSSLYTHKKRVHQVYPTKVQVTLVDNDDIEMAR